MTRALSPTGSSGYPPNALYRTGWKKDVTMKTGHRDRFAWRARDCTNWAHARDHACRGPQTVLRASAGTGDGGNALP